MTMNQNKGTIKLTKTLILQEIIEIKKQNCV